MIKKTLIYFFYCNDQWIDIPEVFQLHLRLLKLNINIFNEYKFILAFNDPNNTKFVNKYKKLIIDYLELKKKTVEFLIVQNDPKSREGIYFFTEVIRKLNEYDGLVFFGHNKSDFQWPKKNIYKWIFACHFINFYNIKDVENKLIYDKYIMYGALPIRLIIPWYGSIREDNFYDGSFFWINTKKFLTKYPKEISDHIVYYNNFVDKELVEKYKPNLSFGPLKYITEQLISNICCPKEDLTTLNNIDFIFNGQIHTIDNKQLFYKYGPYVLEDSIDNSGNLTPEQLKEYYEYFYKISQELNIKY